MPAPKLTGAELAGRLIALEAVTLAFAGEIAAAMPPDRAAGMLATIKIIAQGAVDELMPQFSPAPTLAKEIETTAQQYAHAWVEMIGKIAAKLTKAADPATPASPRETTDQK